MANATTQALDFYDTLMNLIESVYKTANIQFHYSDGRDKLATGCTVYDIQTFDDKPIKDCLQMDDAPSGWLCVLEESTTQSEDTSGNPKFKMVDGVMVPQTRPPHVYIGRGGDSLKNLRNRFTGSA